MPPITAAAPTDVRRDVVRVGWVPQVVSERDSLVIQVAIAVGQRDDARAECDRLAATVARLAGRVEELEAANRARLARLAARPHPSPLEALWAAACVLWQESTPATPRWAWPSMLGLLTLALAIVRW